MGNLDITADGEHRYVATVTREDGTTRDYTVQVPTSLLSELNLSDADEPLVVRAALEMILDRPDPTLPQTFSLGDAEKTYPGFTEQLRAAAGR